MNKKLVFGIFTVVLLLNITLIPAQPEISIKKFLVSLINENFQLKWEIIYWKSIASYWEYRYKHRSGGCGGGGSEVIYIIPDPTEALLKDNWMRTDCNERTHWCNGADINRDGNVDGGDLALCGTICKQ